MAVAALNALPEAALKAELLKCCSSDEFAAALAAQRPFASAAALHDAARAVWYNEARALAAHEGHASSAPQLSPLQVSVPGWLQAFAGHPRIGGDVAALRAKFGATATWCEGEQAAAVATASEALLADLAAWNSRYERRFGHVFLICATGVTAADVLAALQRRFPSPPAAELSAAAGEQAKITALRLDKLVSSLEAPGSAAERRVEAVAAHVTQGPPRRPPVTTHVLDTARGCPAAGVEAVLERQEASGAWAAVGRGVTDADGRCATLLAPGAPLLAGSYRLTFETGAYLARTQPGPPFFPVCALCFAVAPTQTGQHFHVPLLLSPFAFSTYRGS